MKKAFSIYFIIILCVFVYTSIVSINDVSEKQVVFLTDGSTIEAQEAWEVSGEVFYEEDEDIYSIDPEYVERISDGGPQYLFGQIIRRISTAIRFGEDEGEVSEDSASPIVDYYFSWIKRLCLLALLGGIVFALMKFLNRQRKPKQPDIVTEDSFDEKRRDFNDREKVVDFFLDLFRIQLGATKDTKTIFLPVASKSSASNFVYELRVKNNGDWTSRRMTIGVLAEESGSKSKCFEVTYDDRIVVKIPPTPVKDFDAYLANIKEENRIVEKLAPKKCIIPRVSVVLKRIPSVFDGMGWRQEEFEEKSIERLRKFAKYHKHLMIDGSFVYFMDLSKYYFLGDIVREMHDIDNKVHTEIMGHPGVIWEPDGYERRYCSDGSDPTVCNGIQDVFDIYEKELKPLLSKSDLSSVLPYQIQSWFLMHLGGQNVPENQKGLTKAFVYELNELVKKIIKENFKAVEDYRLAIEEYIRKTSYSQHKAEILSIVSNLLELLAWLGDKKVAMRDLKPDNLLVAGDPANYPNFLTIPEEFEIGLIDVETAVIIENSAKGHIEQPMLAGTPLYATPSHLFTNDILTDTFGDLPGILHYQDWYAILAIIYNVINGEPLFNQTAKVLPTIRTAMQKTTGNAKDVAGVLKDVSKLFWQSATDEFKEKLNQKAGVMRDAEVPIAKNTVEMIKNYMVKEVAGIDKTIQEIIYSQTIFTNDTIRKQLLESSHEKIQQFQKKIENKESSLINQLADKEETVKLLEDICRLKQRREKIVRMKKKVETPKIRLAAYEIVEFLFEGVLKEMYSDKWSERSTAVSIDSDASDNSSTIEATIEK